MHNCLHLFGEVVLPFREGSVRLHMVVFSLQEERSRSRSWSPTGGGLVGSADSKFKVQTR